MGFDLAPDSVEVALVTPELLSKGREAKDVEATTVDE
jgi:hypothetical protein